MLLPAGGPHGWGEAADGARCLVWGGFAWEWVWSGTPGKQHGEAEGERSLFLCQQLPLELRLSGSSRGRGKTDFFLFAVDT